MGEHDDAAPDQASWSSPPGFAGDLERYLRSLALAGRGDNARGRNLNALLIFDRAEAHGWVSYAPSRDPGRWLVMLLDLVGARAGLAPRARLTMRFGEWLALLRANGLPRLAEVTRHAVGENLEPRCPGGARSVEACPVLEILWALDYDPGRYRRQVNFEKHSQGKLIRRKIAALLDDPWCAAVRAEAERRGGVDGLLVLAAIPPSFGDAYRSIDATLARVGESLSSGPFAVFYALATDAARGGRVWQPPAPFVEGEAYARDDFEWAVGRRLGAARSRRNRHTRSTALAELGLSSYFGDTVRLLDGWLERHPLPELWVAAVEGVPPGPLWFEFAEREAAAIAVLQGRIEAAVGRTLQD
jgi:hypothetical protein